MSDDLHKVAYAFPVRINNELTSLGMTLRDYFAAKALQGMLTNGFIPNMVKNEISGVNYAAFAYEVADDMLKAREE